MENPHTMTSPNDAASAKLFRVRANRTFLSLMLFMAWPLTSAAFASGLLCMVAAHGSARAHKTSYWALGSLCSLQVNAVRALTSTHHPNAVTFKARPALGFFGIVPLESTVLPFP